MKTILLWLVIALVALSLPACIMEEKTLDIVFTGETSADFAENEDDATDDPEIAVVDIADELRDILEDNDVALSEVKDAFVSAVSYGVSSFSQSHDWTVSGAVSVRRVDLAGSFTPIANYTSVSVQGALGQKTGVPLLPAGVAIVNQALDDFLAGQSPVLEFQLENSSVAPAPSGADPMVFDWRAWLAIQLITTETVDVPDPF